MTQLHPTSLLSLARGAKVSHLPTEFTREDPQKHTAPITCQKLYCC